MSGKSLGWVASYLQGRKMCIKVTTAKSSVRSFNYSVPQRSCLGPLLFNMYTSTIVNCINPEQHLAGYADDHLLMDYFFPTQPHPGHFSQHGGSESSCIDRMEKSLSNIKEWMDDNMLKMNTSKTEVTLFGSRDLLPKTSTNTMWRVMLFGPLTK